MPLGRKTMRLEGQSPSVVDHGSDSSPGSTLLAVMLSASRIGLPPGGGNRNAPRKVIDLPRRGCWCLRGARDDRRVVQARPGLEVERVDVAGSRRERDRLSRVRVVASVDARHDVGALAVDVGVTVEVAVCAEL